MQPVLFRKIEPLFQEKRTLRPFRLQTGNSSNAKYEIGAYKSKNTPLETVKIYILFSPDSPLVLPDDSKLKEQRIIRSGEHSILPFDSMPMQDFQSWLHTLRAKNKSLQYDWSVITIR